MDRPPPVAPLIRRADDRGRFRNHWLDARFSFSFGSYQARPLERFGPLIALNEDFVQPAQGFGMHPHQDLEIVMLPLRGSILHADSLGQTATVQPGSAQHISAGRGIEHSQMNASATEVDRHLQIWFEPKARSGTPRVEQREFDPAARRGRWQALVTPDGNDGSFAIHCGAAMHIGELGAGGRLVADAEVGRSRYLHVVDGTLQLHGAGAEPVLLGAGDGIALWQADRHEIDAVGEAATVLRFDVESVTPPARWVERPPHPVKP
jgi:redox-sensitive bicupin YhaK (pirin superfamily)